jgi:hypothetical protein
MPLMPFQNQGKTCTIAATNGAASALVKFSQLGLIQGQAPSSLRVINNGTVDVWISFTQVTTVAAFPTPGTVDGGTPQYGYRLKPGIVEIIAFNVVAANPGADQPPIPGFWVNTISTVAAQNIDITPGEGI